MLESTKEEEEDQGSVHQLYFEEHRHVLNEKPRSTEEGLGVLRRVEIVRSDSFKRFSKPGRFGRFRRTWAMGPSAASTRRSTPSIFRNTRFSRTG